jgi:hypothetical protein
MSTHRPPTQAPLYPTDWWYEAEEAVWRAGPPELADAPRLPGPGELDGLEPLDDVDLSDTTTFDAFTWMATACLGGPDTSAEWRKFAQETVAKVQECDQPCLGWCLEGFPVRIYPGHLVYRGEVYVAPRLFEPRCTTHAVFFADTVVHAFVDKKWHCGARLLSSIDCEAAEWWRIAAWTGVQ